MLEIIQNNEKILSRVANKISYLNRDYSLEEVKSMTITSLFELSLNKDFSEKELYWHVLNRVLDEKGFKYQDNSPYKPMFNVDSPEEYNAVYERSENRESWQALLDVLFRSAGLSEEEVVVTALSFNLSTPNALTGGYKHMLDNMEDLYYTKKLSNMEISMLIGLTPQETTKIKKTAWKKLEDLRENK